jgi:hypothetical protein
LLGFVGAGDGSEILKGGSLDCLARIAKHRQTPIDFVAKAVADLRSEKI